MGAYNFTIDIEGVNAGYFKGVDGLQAEIEVIEFQDGDDYFLRKRPGRAKFSEDMKSTARGCDSISGRNPCVAPHVMISR